VAGRFYAEAVQLVETSVIGIRTSITVLRRRPGGLKFVQRVGRDLVHQDIDYGSLGVPVIFPDEVLGLDVGPDRALGPVAHRGRFLIASTEGATVHL
jgi:hypothetical protein